MARTHLTAAQRAQLRKTVAAERERTATRAAALAREFDNIVTASADAVRDDEHDPEGATIAFERAQVAALLDDAKALMAALAHAKERLEREDAGHCTSCGSLIAFERLLARPTSTRCVRCASGGPR